MTTISKHYATAILDGDIELRVVEVEATLDRNWSPYAQATIVIGIPSDEVLALLDPRLGARITLTLHQDFGDVYMLSALTQAWPNPTPLSSISAAYDGLTLAEFTDQYRNSLNPSYALSSATRPLDLGIRELEIDHRSARVTIRLESDEALTQDYAPTGTAPLVLGYTSVRDAVEYVLAQIGATLTAGILDDTIEADSTTWEPGVTGWDFLEPIIQKAGLRLWCDEARVWRLDDAVAVLPGSISLSYLRTVTEATDTLSRAAGDWCDAVVVRYEWTETDGTRHIEFDSAVAVGGGGKVRLVEHRDLRYPGPGAAANILRHTANRGRTVGIQAVSDYSATPGVACVIAIPNAPVQTGIVAGVTWRLPADEMTVASRALTDTPAGAYALANPTMTYDDAPAGVAYEDWINPDGD
jgi:hypothetical protein